MRRTSRRTFSDRVRLGSELFNLIDPAPIAISKKEFIRESKLKRFIPVAFIVKGTRKIYYLSPKFRSDKK